MNRGHVVIGGCRLEIECIALIAGKIRVTASAPGPLRAGNGYVTLFGEDGRGVCQGADMTSWPEISAADHLALTWYWAVGSMTSDRRPNVSG